MSKPIQRLVDDLPDSNMTTMLLNGLDFIVPGEWQNVTGFVNTIKFVTGEDDEDLIQQIGDRAITLYNDKGQGYQNAVWLYQTVDTADSALGAAALANRVGESIPLLGFLSSVTPKPDKAQTIDLLIKLVVEVVAFCRINGLPGDSIGDFVAAIADYSGESIMRLAALVAVDAVLPLGPDFVLKAQETLGNLRPPDLENNPVFSSVSSMIPGGDAAGKLGFIGDSFSAVSGWMGDFASSKGLTPENIARNLKNTMEFADDKLDYVAAFLDMTTNYYEHTGIQGVARSLINRAYDEI